MLDETDPLKSYCRYLKEKSGVVTIVGYSRDYTVANGVLYFISNFFTFNLQNCIFQSAKKSKMTSF